MLLGVIAGLFDSLQNLIAGQLIFIEADGHLVRQQIDVALFDAVQLADVYKRQGQRRCDDRSQASYPIRRGKNAAEKPTIKGSDHR